MSTAPQFWNLHQPWGQEGKFRAEWDETMDLEQITCPINPNHRRGGKRTTDLSVVLPKRQTFDVMWTWHSECLIQQRTLDVFREQGFSGFDIKPVQARFKRSALSDPPRFWELVVTGWAGLAAPESGIRFDQEKSCPYCGSLHYTRATDLSRLIDERNWDGSDFFLVWPLPRFIFVTDRVRGYIEKHGIQLTELSRPQDLHLTTLNPTLNLGFSPGHLSSWMPDHRAHELGDPLGIY